MAPIINPLGAYRQPHTSGLVGADGLPLELSSDPAWFIARENLVKGRLVALIATDDPVGVAVTTSIDDAPYVVGVTDEDAAAGDIIRVIVGGFAWVLASESISAQAILTSASDGKVQDLAPAASTIIGAAIGFAVGAGTNNNLMPIWLKPV